MIGWWRALHHFINLSPCDGEFVLRALFIYLFFFLLAETKNLCQHFSPYGFVALASRSLFSLKVLASSRDEEWAAEVR